MTAAPEEIPDPLINQLERGGTLVAPVGGTDEAQFLTRVTKSEDGEVQSRREILVRFVPMTGETEN